MHPKATDRSPAVLAVLPPTSELFDKHQLAARHPHLLNIERIQWALRHRHTNGLREAVYESRGGEHLIHEPSFLAWFLRLSGRAKPRALRKAA